MEYTGWSYGQLCELPADYEPILWARIEALNKAAAKAAKTKRK